MRDDKPTTMRDLEKRVEDEVHEQAPEYLRFDEDDDEVREWLHELVDGAVPIMNYTLLEVAMDDLTLGFPEEMHEEPDNVYAMLSWSIFERLREKAEEVWQRIKSDDVEARERRAEQGECLYRVAVRRNVELKLVQDVVAESMEDARRIALEQAAQVRKDRWREVNCSSSEPRWEATSDVDSARANGYRDPDV